MIQTETRFRLHVEPLVQGGRAFDIPCDPQGRVDVDALDDRGRNAYFCARLARRLGLADPVVVADTV